MSEQNFSNQNNRPAWAWHMSEAKWQEQLQNNPRAQKYVVKSESDDIAHPPTIQEENINATPLKQNIITLEGSAANTSDATSALPDEKEDSANNVEEAPASSPETKPAASEDEQTQPVAFEQDDTPITLSAPADTPQAAAQNASDADFGDNAASTHKEAERKPKYSYVKDECEQPVRGYKALIFIPLLTLAVLLAIHTSSFIYNFSDNLVLQNPTQIEMAQSLNGNSTFFVPTLDNLPVKNISPAALWFLAAIYKWIPAPELLNLHLAAAITALLVLAGTCLLSRGTTPARKDVALSAGLVLLASPLFLGLAWVFKTEMLVLALYTFSLALLFLGLHKEKSAFYYVVPGMILGALGVLGCGPALLIPLLLTPFLFLLLSGRIKRLAAKDTVWGFAALLIILALWLIGAITLNGSAILKDYLTPWWLANAELQANLSLKQQIIFAGVLLLPWLLLPLLLIDRIALDLVKVSALRESLRTQAGQGKLFLICSLLGVLPLLALDKLEHPLLALLLLPGIAVLAARTVLNMNLSRARVFTVFCALLLLALAAFMALLPTETLSSILPWQFSFLQVAPLAAAALLCVFILLRAAKTCAGRALFVTLAISWLLMAQVFLVFGLPTLMPYLKLDHLRSDILTEADKYQTVLLDVPAWANYPPLPGAVTRKNWSEVKEMLYDYSVQVVLPASLWSDLNQPVNLAKPTEAAALLQPDANASSALTILPASLGTGNQTANASNSTLEPQAATPPLASNPVSTINEQMPFKETARQYLLLTPYVLARAEKAELSPELSELRQKLKALDFLNANLNANQSKMPLLAPFLLKIVDNEKTVLAELNKAALASSKDTQAAPEAPSLSVPADVALPSQSQNATLPAGQPNNNNEQSKGEEVKGEKPKNLQPDLATHNSTAVVPHSNATLPLEGAPAKGVPVKADAQSPHEPATAPKSVEKMPLPASEQKQVPGQAAHKGNGQVLEQTYEQVTEEIVNQNMQQTLPQSEKTPPAVSGGNATQP